jgi:hypothetical protein
MVSRAPHRDAQGRQPAALSEGRTLLALAGVVDRWAGRVLLLRNDEEANGMRARALAALVVVSGLSGVVGCSGDDGGSSESADAGEAGSEAGGAAGSEAGGAAGSEAGGAAGSSAAGAAGAAGAPARGCVTSGGTITTASCCESTGNFPNLCLVGACGCAPEYSHDVRICRCPAGQCFDGTACVTE